MKQNSVQDKYLNNSRDMSNCFRTLEEIKSNNPQYVTTYSKEIMEFLKKKEAASERPNYLENQSDLTEKMREILIDWLVDVSVKFRLNSTTQFMSVNLIDRYLALAEVTRDKLQQLGITALFIASKYEEIYPPHMKEYIKVCDKATYSKEQILDMESKIIIGLNFSMTDSTTQRLLERYGRVADLNAKAFMFSRYLIEQALVDSAFIVFHNSLIASASVYLTNKIFKLEEWSPYIESDTGYKMSSIRPVAKQLYLLLHKVEDSPQTAVRRKFASKTYLEISKYKLEWNNF